MMNDAESGDDAGGGRLGVILIMRDEESDLEQVLTRIEQECDALAGCELSLTMLALDLVGATAESESLLQLVKLGGQACQPARA